MAAKALRELAELKAKLTSIETRLRDTTKSKKHNKALKVQTIKKGKSNDEILSKGDGRKNMGKLKIFAKNNSSKYHDKKSDNMVRQTLKVIKPVISKETHIKMENYKRYLNMGDKDATNADIEKKKTQCMCLDYTVEDVNNGLVDKNIEMKRCTRNVVNGSNFCKIHQNCPNELKKFTSGYEPAYDPVPWNEDYARSSHNCYAYFLNNKKTALIDKCRELCLKKHKNPKDCLERDEECRQLIPQPGDLSLLLQGEKIENNNRKMTCPNLHNSVMADNPSIKPSTFAEKCPAKYYKGAAVVKPGKTFHFYRQDNNGTWSHKPGLLDVTNKDASGNPIYIPHFSDRDYDNDPKYTLSYKDFCGYYCIPDGKYIKTNMA